MAFVSLHQGPTQDAHIHTHVMHQKATFCDKKVVGRVFLQCDAEAKHKNECSYDRPINLRKKAFLSERVLERVHQSAFVSFHPQ